ncbi:MAG: hypothetical protein ACXVBE_09020, partial [Bdellovibrionota bacterium]
HPTDTGYNLAVARLLEKEGLPHKPVTGAVRAWNNASRSLYVEDPKIGYVFELKGSTDKAPGIWKDKALFAGAIEEMGRRDDYVQRYAPQVKLRHTELTYEPAMFVFKNQEVKDGVPTGVIARDLGLQRNSKQFLLPGYSALEGDLGKQIALANGSTDPAKFWEEHYIRPLARSLAEMKTELGLEITSAHSQNFYIVLDEHLRPTGLIRHKDFTDGDIHTSLLEARGRTIEGPGRGRDTAHRNGKIYIESSVFSGTRQTPSWQFVFSGHNDVPWNKAFIEEFEAEMELRTGVPKAEWAKARVHQEPKAGSTYKFMNYYPEDSGPWKQFLENIKSGKIPPLPEITAKAGAAGATELGGTQVSGELQEARELLAGKSVSTAASKEKLSQLFRMDPEAVIQALLELKIKGELTPELEKAFQVLIKQPTNREVSKTMARGLWELGDRQTETMLKQFEFVDDYAVSREAFEYATKHNIRDPRLIEKAVSLMLLEKTHIPEDATKYLIAVSPIDEQLLMKLIRDTRNAKSAPIYMDKLLKAQPLTTTLRTELVSDVIKRSTMRTDALNILRKDQEVPPLLVQVLTAKTGSIEEKSAALDLLTETGLTKAELDYIHPFLESFSKMPDANSGAHYLIKAQAIRMLESSSHFIRCNRTYSGLHE